MQTYPLTPSQQSKLTGPEWIAFLQNPTLIARRLSEILSAQQFLGYFLLQGRYDMQGGTIMVPRNEVIRTDRSSEVVAPGADYKLTTLSAEQYELYSAMKDGLATIITDEQVGRSLRQPIDDALLLLQTELVFSANDLAVAAILSSLAQTLPAGATWTTGKAVLRTALKAKARIRAQRLGFDLDTVVLPGDQYAEVLPELLELLPDGDTTALTGSFPTIAGLTWVSDDSGTFTSPLIIDRRRLGGIGRENIPSPEYREVGNDTGVGVMTKREASDSTRIQARNPHTPVVVNPQAGFFITGTR